MASSSPARACARPLESSSHGEPRREPWSLRLPLFPVNAGSLIHRYREIYPGPRRRIKVAGHFRLTLILASQRVEVGRRVHVAEQSIVDGDRQALGGNELQQSFGPLL